MLVYIIFLTSGGLHEIALSRKWNPHAKWNCHGPANLGGVYLVMVSIHHPYAPNAQATIQIHMATPLLEFVLEFSLRGNNEGWHVLA